MNAGTFQIVDCSHCGARYPAEATTVKCPVCDFPHDTGGD